MQQANNWFNKSSVGLITSSLGTREIQRNSKSTGLCSHFMEGCPFDPGPEKMTLDFSLIDFFDTTEDQLKSSNHVPGPKCRCKECQKLKDLEDKWIMKLGSFYGKSALNNRNEIKSKTRGQWNPD